MSTNSNICIILKNEDKNKPLKFNIEKIPSVNYSKFNYDKEELNKIKEINTDKNVLEIYHHWDGYPDGVGKTLIEDYNDYDKALNLILGGDCSSINPPQYEPYWSIKGEEWEYIKPKEFDEPKLGREYLYKFDKGKWFFKDIYTHDDWTDLADFLAESENEVEFTYLCIRKRK